MLPPPGKLTLGTQPPHRGGARLPQGLVLLVRRLCHPGVMFGLRDGEVLLLALGQSLIIYTCATELRSFPFMSF